MWQPALLVLNSVAMSLISAKKPIAEILKEILNLKQKDLSNYIRAVNCLLAII